MNTSCLKMNTIVSKHVGSVMIYKLIVILLLLVILQNKIKKTVALSKEMIA